MKKISPFILLFALLFSNGASARNEPSGLKSFTGPQELHNVVFDRLSINGTTDLKNVKLKEGNITGNLDFEGLDVSKKLDVNGHIYGQEGKFYNLHAIGTVRLTNSSMASLTVTGPTTLKNCSVKGNANIIGLFEAVNSTIGHVEVTGDHIILHDSKVGAIRIKKTSSLTQKLILNNSSAKDIIFEGGHGKIVVIGNAEIIGRVVGGVVVKESTPIPARNLN